MRNIRRYFSAAWAAPAGLLGCLGCSQTGPDIDLPGHGEGALLEVADESSAEPVDPGGGAAHEAPPSIQRLGSESYRELDIRGRQRLAAVLARPTARDSQRPDFEGSGEEALDRGENASPETELPTGLNELWMQFLSRVEPMAAGGFIVEDMGFADEKGLIDHFLAVYGQYFDKGLVISSKAWPRPSGAPLLHVCWLAGNVTLAEQQRVEALVQASWPKMTELVFNFSSSGTMNNCASAAPDGSWEIRIRQDSSITRGCSAIGSDSLSASCGEATASMILPVPATGSSRSWADATTVHEFGHAIGLVHEQIRLEYDWHDPSLPPPPASLPRNCPDADVDITYIPPGQFLNERLTPADIGAQTVGAFDDDSLMYYCRATETLQSDNPRMSEVSVGDIASAQFLYPTNMPNREGIFQHSSWQNIQVRLTFQGTNFTVNSGPTVATKTTGITRRVGNTYTASAVSLNGSTLKCNTRARPLGVFTNDAIVPPVGFSVSPIVVDCFDPASLMVAVN
jgi:hypothetical protein